MSFINHGDEKIEHDTPLFVLNAEGHVVQYQRTNEPTDKIFEDWEKAGVAEYENLASFLQDLRKLEKAYLENVPQIPQE